MITNEERMRRLAEKLRVRAEKITQQAERHKSKGLEQAQKFLVARIRETLGVATPKKKVVSRKFGNTYYRAITPATAGAPPRKITGNLQKSIKIKYSGSEGGVIVSTAKYAKYLEHGKHPFIKPTIEKYRAEILRIIARTVYVHIK